MSAVEKMKNSIRVTLVNAVLKANILSSKEDIPEIQLEAPRDKMHGDLATNLAMQLTKIAKQNPRQIAEKIIAHIEKPLSLIERAEIAGPGFINFRINKRYLYEVIEEVLTQEDSFGQSNFGQGEKIQVEFVSANPTGTLHLGHARGAAVGDALCNLLKTAGFVVTREYYVNDAGNQVTQLVKSLEARYCQSLGIEVEMPTDGYYGKDIILIAEKLAALEGARLLSLTEEDRFKFLRDYSLKVELTKIKHDLERFGVYFDNWFSEMSLYETQQVADVVNVLKDKGHTYENEGALWLSSTKFGDDKDRVLIKKDGSYTYLTPDAAYHQDKYKRGFTRMINIWGADHHGYIARMKATLAALGNNPNQLVVLIAQMVSLYQEGEKIKMSKRTGKALTMEDLMDEVGVDAIRYFFTMRSLDSQLDFDMDLAISKSNENPVFYVQYAHARICSIFSQAKMRGIVVKNWRDVNLTNLTTDREFSLLQKIGEFPNLIEEAAKLYAPHLLIRYVHELATEFHSYYRVTKVVIEDEGLMQSRLQLLAAIKITIANVLRLVGVSAPEKM